MLTRVQVENAKAKEKAYRLFDGRGLYLEVHPPVVATGGSSIASRGRKSGSLSASIRRSGSRRRAIGAMRLVARWPLESIHPSNAKLRS
jgi:hypothetical protein